MAIAPETKIPWPTRLRRGFLWLVGLGLLGVVFLEILIHTTRFPDSTKEPLNGTPVIYDAEGGVLATLAEKGARSRVVGKLSEMGRWLPEVTVALEDHRFYDHSGVDPYAIVAAAWSDIRASRLRRGGSTITQQVIKQDLGKRGRDWRRKWLEAILALKLEREWTKRQVLEGYLNRLDYGNRRIGAESASLSYFGKRCGALTLAEAVYLAGLPQAPTRYNPWKNPKKALQKYERSINRL
ncbi:MAG: penicillin-binding protein, partial [Verrucomicrobiaceae bacterium]|nr:penicillin-binding protein [Verrucomicrobiaceae bacterium]NCF90844.1 penicillin-binding protein [Verrucomicrobiaceae bacterium]